MHDAYSYIMSELGHVIQICDGERAVVLVLGLVLVSPGSVVGNSGSVSEQLQRLVVMCFSYGRPLKSTSIAWKMDLELDFLQISIDHDGSDTN
ncbi:hypothetical protein L1987_76182 [Smallanthus sonchifolius]|uniref:Uncharacterized protein n=1 Tax=Smallanthus sonchifolius TaxID=185202 RepID=A0ACB9A992_9ASTR|nr:hypothetical protein L1987_76182 [Smallanthus sonchifolius]